MEESHPNDIADVLRLDANLGRAPRESLVELAREARRLRFDKGDYVFCAGDPSEEYCLVESGRVILSKESPSGTVITHLVAVRGMPLNAVTCFRARRRFFSARVAEASTIVAIPCREFTRWVGAHPEVGLGILSTMGEMLDGAYTRILGLVDESAETRVLNALSMLAARMGPELALTNSDVAELVGVSRETAARVVSRLQDAGLLAKSRGSITILDRDRLDGMATSPRFVL